VLVVVALAATAPLLAQQEVIAVIQVHGNTISPTDEVVALSGLAVGASFSEAVRADAEQRLQKSGRFQDVEVLKRFASISDLTQITVLIRIDDGPVRIDPPLPGIPGGLPTPGVPQAVRRGPLNVMFAPILTAEDGYGFTYGARFAVTGHRNTRQRIAVPLSWGGDKRAGVEFQKEFARRESCRSSLRLRHHIRRSLALPARFRLAPETGAQMRVPHAVRPAQARAN